MKTHIFDLEDQYFGLDNDNALLAIDDIAPNGDITLDIWGSVGEQAVIDIKNAENKEVIINKFEVQVPNAISIKFLAKKFAIKIKELIFKCGGINYQGGAIAENLSVFTCRPEVQINSDSIRNISIETVPYQDEEPIRQMLTGIEIIPGCGEFVYDPDCSNAKRSLTELKTALPSVKWVAPVVAWFADSLNIVEYKIKPGIDRNYSTKLDSWQVGNYTKNSAHVVSVNQQNDSIYGGSVNDQSLLNYLQLLKKNDLNIIFYPLIMVDTPGKPWRGRIGAQNNEQDKINNANYIESFFQNQYRPFIIHYACLVKDRVDAFIIGSELIGLTSIYDQNKNFPFVQKLIELSGEVKQILGKKVKITYAADWSEYHSTCGGLRPLDDLWASENIDFVGIDAYFPITDSLSSRISSEEIKRGWHSGEGYDYYYSGNDKISFVLKHHAQWKNLSHWWLSEHWAWDEENKKSIKTPWLPKSKPIWFTEIGFPSIDKAPNKPNVFYNPESSESAVPSRSSGKIDYAIQLRAIRASLEYWQGSEFLEQMIFWTWDARGLGWQNNRAYYADGYLWDYGHWLDSKIHYRSLEVTVNIKNVENFTITGEDLSLWSDIEAENILIKTSKQIKIYDRHTNISRNAFITGNNLKIEDLDANGTLFFENLSVNIENNIEIKNCDFKIGENALLIGDNLNISGRTSLFENLLIEIKNNVKISSEIRIGSEVFIKCQNIWLKNHLSGKNLFIEASNIFLETNINSLELLCIDGETLNIGHIDLRIAQIIINLKNNLNIACPRITYSRSESYDGGKTRILIENQIISPKRTISAMLAEFNIGGSFIIPPMIIDIEELYIKAGELSLQVMTTDHKQTIFFTGAKDWKGARQAWQEVTFVQTPCIVEINANSLLVEVEDNFAANASKIKAETLSMEAKNFAFQGKNLEGYVTKFGHTKRDIFGGKKSYHSESKHTSIEGVKVVVAGTAYMIAHGQIWLQASGVSARELVVKAPKILLEGVVGSDYHNMNVTKKGIKLSLTCSTKEISGGIEAYKQTLKTRQYREHIVPSILQGREKLEIEADNIHQHGSILSAKIGKIKANSWTSSAPTLTQSYSENRERVSVGATVGIKQNVSSAIEGLNNTHKAIKNYDSDNNFAALNLASSAYGNFQALTNLASGNIVSAGAWLSANYSTSSSRESHTTHVLSRADFEELTAEIKDEISGTLEIDAETQNVSASSINLERPEDKHHSSHRQTGMSVGTGGISASHYQEKNGKGFGVGYSASFGSSNSNFGPSVSIQYKDGKNHLDVSYASMNKEQVAESWSGGIGGIASRMENNLISQTDELTRLVSSPTAIIDEFKDQLTSAAEAISGAVAGVFDSSSASCSEDELKARKSNLKEDKIRAGKGKEKLEDNDNDELEDEPGENFGFDDADEIDDAEYLAILKTSRDEQEERRKYAPYADDNKEGQGSSSNSTPSNIVSELFGISEAQGATGITLGAYGSGGSSVGEFLPYAISAQALQKMGAAAISATELAPALIPLGIAYAEYTSAQNYANNLEYYSNLAYNSDAAITPAAEDFVLANPRGVFDPANPHDFEALQHIARGVAIDRLLQKQATLSSASGSNAGPRSVATSLAGTDNNNNESGICKVSYTYRPDDDIFKQKEPWMLDINLTNKKQQLLQGKVFYGLNPTHVEVNRKGITEINTALPGGDIAARECFKNLTGNEVPTGIVFKAPYPGTHLITGKRVQYRPDYLSRSNHPKVDIFGDNHEKITFINSLPEQ